MTSNYRDLIAWQKAMNLVVAVYDASSGFPRAEQFGLTSQMRRAAISIPCNVAEGFGRRNRPEFQRFIRNSRGSACELETQIELAKRLRLIDEAAGESIANQASEVSRILNGLHAALERSERGI